jgi:hypothetical protein
MARRRNTYNLRGPRDYPIPTHHQEYVYFDKKAQYNGQEEVWKSSVDTTQWQFHEIMPDGVHMYHRFSPLPTTRPSIQVQALAEETRMMFLAAESQGSIPAQDAAAANRDAALRIADISARPRKSPGATTTTSASTIAVTPSSSLAIRRTPRRSSQSQSVRIDVSIYIYNPSTIYLSKIIIIHIFVSMLI